MSKGSKRRPCSIGKEEKAIRDALAWGEITKTEFDKQYDVLLKDDKITRSGKVVKEC